MFNIGIPELVLILVIALIVFGPGKLPKVGRALGDGISEFKKAAAGLTDGSDDDARDDETASDGGDAPEGEKKSSDDES